MMKKALKLFLVLALALGVGAAAANDRTRRANSFEGTLLLPYIEMGNTSFNNGSSIAFDGGLGLGFTFAYNFDAHFSLGILFQWADADYTAQVKRQSDGVTATVTGEAYFSNFDLVGTYYFLDKAFTPYISGSVGTVYVDTGIPTAPPTNDCYWWWYTYVCGTYQPTASAYEVAYGAGLGLRWEVNRSFFLKGGVDRKWIDVSGASNTPTLDTWRVDLGLRF